MTTMSSSDETTSLPSGIPTAPRGAVALATAEGELSLVYVVRHPVLGTRTAVTPLGRMESSLDELERRVAQADEMNRVAHRPMVQVFAWVRLQGGSEYCVEVLPGAAARRS